MRAAAAREPFDSRAHLYEVLWDGVRALLFVDGAGVRLRDSYGRDVSAWYPELAGARAQINGDGHVLDGEILALDASGRPDLPALLRRFQGGAPEPQTASASFQAFDVLYRGGRSVMNEPLRTRKSILRQVLRYGGAAALTEYVEQEGVAFFEAAREHGLPGIVAKERESKYVPGQRTPAWQTMRVYKRGQFVIAGFTYGGPLRAGVRERTQGPVGALLLGAYDDQGKLLYAGEARGLSAEQSAELAQALDAAVTNQPPFAEPPNIERLVFWCRPSLAASVRYSEWTPEGLRFPVFEYLRPDVPAQSCRLPQ
jgi:ATP-dependent DNA ligase